MKANIALIGYRGTGKTTVGQLVAAELGYQFIDTDALIESSAEQSIQEIFAVEGEAGFRDREAEVVAMVVAQQGQVLSLGGGVILREENRTNLAGCRAIVWLQAEVETIRRRLESDPSTQSSRPQLTSQSAAEEIASVLEARTPLYQSLATHCISTEGRTPEQIAQEILAQLG